MSFLLLLAAASVAQASPAPPPAAVAVIKRSDPAEEKICKRVTPIGSRLPQRLCLTAYEWAERRAQSLRDMDQMVGKGPFPDGPLTRSLDTRRIVQFP